MTGENQFHITLNGCGLVLGSFASGTRQLVNQMAAKLGGGGEYADLTDWSQWLMDDWRIGVNHKNPQDGGFLYAELETRVPSKLMLPAEIRYVETGCDACEVEISGACVGETVAACVHFVEYGCETYMACGKGLYRWNESSLSFTQIATLPCCATDLLAFDDHLHIGGGDHCYMWYEVASGTVGSGPITGTNGVPPVTSTADGFRLFYRYNGFLYAARGNEIWYTAGSGAGIGTAAGAPDTWQWTGPIKVGPHDIPITGLAAMPQSTLSQTQLYVSTVTDLYDLLPGDVITHVSPWPAPSLNNGANMITHYGSIYAPVLHGMARITASGQFLGMGLDMGEGLPAELAGTHQDVISTTNWLLTYISPESSYGSPSAWAWSGEGWHYVAKLKAGSKACNGHYSRVYQRLWLALDSGEVATLVMPDRNDNFDKSPNMRFEECGILETGFFHGGLRKIEKDFHSVYVHGVNLSADRTVNVWWRTSAAEAWALLGTVTQDEQELYWPCAGASRARGRNIELRIELCTNDATKTPVVDAVDVRYMAHVRDRWGWQYQVSLPADCLQDACAQDVEEYDQATWDACICAAAASVEPVPFTDLDGSEYFVKVINAAQSFSNLSFEDGERKYDIGWSFGLLQVCPEGIECTPP